MLTNCRHHQTGYLLPPSGCNIRLVKRIETFCEEEIHMNTANKIPVFWWHKSWQSPLFVMRVWSSVRNGLLFSHWMYFFHISTCWASCGEFWGGTEGAFLSSPFITVSYSWTTQQAVCSQSAFCISSKRACTFYIVHVVTCLTFATLLAFM